MTKREDAGDFYRLDVKTPDADINAGAELAARALVEGGVLKAGIRVPTVCGVHGHYPNWVHPYDNHWINRSSIYLFSRESTEWPMRLFSVYQSPTGEILGGVYDIPDSAWWDKWVEVGGPEKWQGNIQRPLADYQAALRRQPEKVEYGIYLREHLFVLQVYDQWQARGSKAFLLEMYGPCRRALKFLEKFHDIDGDGLVESACVLSDLVVAGDRDINSTARAEDQVMLYGALRAFAEMAEVLGGREDTAWALTWAGRIAPQLREKFWRPEGRYIFGIDRVTKRPRLEYVTTTFANGYAILFGLADDAQAEAILDFMARQEFDVPGPYHIPPVREEDGPQSKPGVYCNGGCGWGRGIMPSITLACFRRGRVAQGVDYLKRQAAAARKAGSFHEYWNWGKYAGNSNPGDTASGWYGETSAGHLDALLHGLFGLGSEGVGFQTVKLEPHFPREWRSASLDIRLPNGSRLAMRYRLDDEGPCVEVQTDPPLPVVLTLNTVQDRDPKVRGTGLTATTVEPIQGGRRVTCSVLGKGDVRIS